MGIFLGNPKQAKTVHKRAEYFGQDLHCFGLALKIRYNYYGCPKIMKILQQLDYDVKSTFVFEFYESELN